ncbi:peptidase [Leuconostoc gelidum subsp. gelidum]|uniref:Peptidase n=1 Tax=Leuconostoc gelidum subsp. gelidum TaxID=1607839 RepID=A0ABS7V466_LEUGE|nr:VWA-like domain-containing protein [Leuconostoc gelidum]MBZ5964196.1 peptidase [Leuconostoc gelidum subsp. gelidum]MBZ5975763.1 peptidase [Leuconostoc gelidum subsp. gelidum]MBZ5976758.1 peptidase [Leuconostoc gelidum subsp. gelidum]MBZ5986074.1 peptidase [Leuconostoc gelidum subsp. gelidum]MBZ5999764.1 peptidase [Leuconostoc gelidum subsp. gelidum]
MNDNEKDNLIVDGIKTLLDESPLYGSIVMNLDREIDLNLDHALALKWHNHRWFLVINPSILTHLFTNHNQIALALAHEALHVIWQHPLRYAKQHDSLIDLGTDLAVNQYLPDQLGELPGAMTLQTIFEMYGKMLPAQEDSAVYIARLSKFLDQVPSRGDNQLDSHSGWSSADGALDEAKAALDMILKKATEDAKHSGRGQLSLAVRKHIDEVITPHRNWRAVIRTGLSQQPNKRRESRARFNRRQAYRLDLTGEISVFNAQLVVFIDNSASISDQQAGLMVANVIELTRQFDAEVHVFSFDTQVYAIKKIKDWVRHTGGGTTFQSIFNALIDQKFNPKQTIVVILTDGDGEKNEVQTAFKQVYWLLPQGKRLSISQPFGKVVVV